MDPVERPTSGRIGKRRHGADRRRDAISGDPSDFPDSGLLRLRSRNDDKLPYFSPFLNGSSLPGGTVSSAIASSIATIT